MSENTQWLPVTV